MNFSGVDFSSFEITMAGAESYLAAGNDINATDNLGATFLHQAALEGDRNVIAFLLGSGADRNAKTNHGFTPYDWARTRGNLDLAQLLRTEDFREKSSDGGFEITIAGVESYLNFSDFEINMAGVELYLAAGNDINATDNLGATFLHQAALEGDRNVIAFLLGSGADRNAKTNHGFTPYDWARTRGNHDLAQLLRTEDFREKSSESRQADRPSGFPPK